MNEKKARMLRRKAHNLWISFKDDVKKRVTKKKVYKLLKEEYKKK